MRALDNGGRFYNLLTKADDDVLSITELRKAAGVFGNAPESMLFLHLAISALGEQDRRTILQALGPQAKALNRRFGPKPVAPTEFAANARAGTGYLLEGEVRKFDDVTECGFMFVPVMSGKVMTMMPIPTTERFRVYEVRERGAGKVSSGAECLVLTPKQATVLRGRIRFVGIAREGQVGQGANKAKRLRLDARYYCKS